MLALLSFRRQGRALDRVHPVHLRSSTTPGHRYLPTMTAEPEKTLMVLRGTQRPDYAHVRVRNTYPKTATTTSSKASNATLATSLDPFFGLLDNSLRPKREPVSVRGLRSPLAINRSLHLRWSTLL